MPGSPHLREGAARDRNPLIDMTQTGQVPGHVRKHHHMHIGPRRRHVCSAMPGIIHAAALLEYGTGLHKFPEPKGSCRMRKMAKHQCNRVVPRLAPLLQPLGIRQSQPVLGPKAVVRPLAVEQGQQVVGPAELFGKDARPGVGFSHLGRRIPSRSEQCGRQRDLQIKLQLLAPYIVGEVRELVQPLL